MALSFVAKHGFGPGHPAVVAAEKGDFSLIGAELAAKGATGWEQHVKLAEQWFERSEAARADNDKATATLVTSIAGSAEAWGEVSNWASQNAEPVEKEVINGLLAQGGFAAELAAGWLVNAFRNATGNSYQGKSAVNPNASAAPPTSFAPLDPKSYGSEVAALRARMGNSMEGSREYEALRQRRMAYRG